MNIIEAIAAPAGSGSNFALSLLNSATERYRFSSIGHERKDFQDKESVIVILRNPYDTVASGAERWIKSSKHEFFLESEDLVEETDLAGIKERIFWEELRYYDFFKNIEKLNNVKILSFELLTENPDSFIEQVTEFFGIRNNFDRLPDSEIFDLIAEDGRANRVPRAELPGRTIINELIVDMFPKEKWDCWKIYSELKTKLDAEGL